MKGKPFNHLLKIKKVSLKGHLNKNNQQLKPSFVDFLLRCSQLSNLMVKEECFETCQISMTEFFAKTVNE